MLNVTTQDHGLELALDNQIIAAAKPAIEKSEKVVFESKINVNPTVGTMTSHGVTRCTASRVCPQAPSCRLNGSAGQSWARSCARVLHSR